MLSPPPTAESTASGEEKGDHLGKIVFYCLTKKKKKKKDDHLRKIFATFESLHERPD